MIFLLYGILPIISGMLCYFLAKIFICKKKQDVKLLKNILNDLKIMADNGWDKNEKYVLAALEQIQESNKELKKSIFSITDRISKLEVQIGRMGERLAIKSGIWGAIAGAIPASIALVILMVKTMV